MTGQRFRNNLALQIQLLTNVQCLKKLENTYSYPTSPVLRLEPRTTPI